MTIRVVRRTATRNDLPVDAILVQLAETYVAEHVPDMLRYRRHARDADIVRLVVGQRLERLAVGVGIRQQVDAVAHHRRAERFECAQHAHARGRILDRQLRDGQQPAGRRRCRLGSPLIHVRHNNFMNFDKELDARGLIGGSR